MQINFITDNFMLQDFLYTILAFIMLPLFVVVPGYVLGWATNPLDFRQRRLLTRLLLGTTLSVAVVPAFSFLFGRLTHIRTMWWIYIPIWIMFLWLIIPNLRRVNFPKDRWIRWAIGLTLIWVVLATFSTIDLQFDQGVYFNVVAFDWSHRVAITDAIARTGIPPVNPFFFPGESVHVSYYYFWSIIPALLNQFTGGIITARIAFLASAIWCGIALRSIAALYLRFITPEGRNNIGPRSVAAFFLFFITGLDIIFIAIMLSKFPDFPGISEGWNGSSGITSWIGSSLWVPNHAASLIACLTGFILFQSITPFMNLRNRITLIAIVGICLSSALGMSIYVTLVFALFWGLWILVSLLNKEMRYKAVWLFGAGLFVLFFTSPFLFDTLKNRSNINIGSSIFTFKIRPIFLVETSSLVQNTIRSEILLNLIHLLLLPVNYFLELGFFMLAGLVYLQSSFQNIKTRKIIGVEILLLLTSIIICSFVKSTIIENNDLGWRGILPAQFILLIWSANVFTQLFPRWFGLFKNAFPIKISNIVRYTMVFILSIGLLSSAFDLFHLRFFFVMYDKQLWLTSLGGVYPAQDYGSNILSLRQAYQFIQDEFPKDAIIQNNPDVPDIDLAQGLYGDHQTVISGPGATTYGVSRADYQRLADQIIPLFSDTTISSEKVHDLCSEHSIDVIILSNIDPVWEEPHSWIWQQKPIFMTPSVRLFQCKLIQ